MKHQNYTLITMFILVMMLSCHKDTEILPEVTQSGKGVFACMYDGTVLNIEGAYAGYQNDEMSSYPVISMVAYYSNTSNPYTISVLLEHISAPGVYSLNKKNAKISARLNTDDHYDRYVSFSGTIELTVFDTINHLISGKFNADLVLSQGGSAQQGATISAFKDTILIRAGRFDLPLAIYKYR